MKDNVAGLGNASLTPELGSRPASHEIFQHPWRFVLRVLHGFHANQGFLLAGAVAYNALLSIIPLFTLLLLALSHVVDEQRLLTTLSHYLELITPGRSKPLVEQMETVLDYRQVLGWVLVGVMLFFSSIAFYVLENAMTVIFYHRVARRRRHFLTSVLLPYAFILMLGVGFVVVTFITGVLQAVGSIHIFIGRWDLSLEGLSAPVLYLLGLGGQILMLTTIYLVMPVGRLSLRHALIGGTVAGLLWEVIRHGLIWYFSNLSLVNVVYGSLATAIIVLLTMEVAAIILLLGAQVIAEYERLCDMAAGEWNDPEANGSRSPG